MNVFKVTDNAGHTEVYRLPEVDGSAVTIGRSDQCNIALVQDLCLSRTHCEVRYWGGLLYLRDCQSSNGTYYEGERISQEVMLPGRVFYLGQSSVTLAEDWEEAYARPLLEEPEPEVETPPPPPPVEEEPAPEPAWQEMPPPPPAVEEPAPEPAWQEMPPPPPVEEEPAPEPAWQETPPPPPAEEEPAPEPAQQETPPPPPAVEEPTPEPVQQETPPPPPPAEEGQADSMAPEPRHKLPPMAPMPGHKLVKVRRNKRKPAAPAAPAGKGGKPGKPAKALVTNRVIGSESGLSVGLPADFRCSLNLLTKNKTLWEGDCLQFSFDTDKDCYLYLMQWDATGHADILVGTQGLEKDNFVPAGAERAYPPLRDREYDFVVEPPFGEDVIVAIACTAPCDFEGALRAHASSPNALESPIAVIMAAIYACSTGQEQWSSAFMRLTTHEGLPPGK